MGRSYLRNGVLVPWVCVRNPATRVGLRCPNQNILFSARYGGVATYSWLWRLSLWLIPECGNLPSAGIWTDFRTRSYPAFCRRNLRFKPFWIGCASNRPAHQATPMVSRYAIRTSLSTTKNYYKYAAQ